jgi:hypothetical protein
MGKFHYKHNISFKDRIGVLDFSCASGYRMSGIQGGLE